jgi:replicative DNA helicase
MRNGEVYVLGANQGSGKTSLALQFVSAALRRRKGVLMFSMEMGWRDVYHRLLAIEARVDLMEYYELQRVNGDASHIVSALNATTSEFLNAPLVVSRKSSVTPDYLIEESSRLKKKHKVDLIVLDHMQLMGSSGTARGDYEKFTAISRANKQAATELNVPILVVSQTSRSNATDKRTELECSDLRGTGAIEEDAAAVMLLYPDSEHREECIARNTFDTGPVKSWLKLGKNRFGTTGTYLPLWHFKTCTRFDPYTDGENQ